MKKIFLLPLILMFFVPAAAQGYSFQTPEYQELRSLVDDLEDNKYTPARQDDKDAWLQEVRDGAEGASASLIRVRDGERKRLAGIYSARVAAINRAADKTLAGKKKAIAKWCARKKRGKTAKQQALIEKTCAKKRATAESSVEAQKKEKIAEVERDYGTTSARYKSLQRSYDRFEENVQEFLARGEEAIDDMPIALPINIDLPVITGIAAVGETLTASAGEWSSSPEATFSYQWERCNANGTGCVDIAGASGFSYQIVPEDVAQSLRIVVTATNPGGSVSEASEVTEVVAA